MKKSSFVAMILGTVSGILFALGMCMTLISEWDAFLQGIILGCIGILLGLITLIVWRKMETQSAHSYIRQTGIDYCCWHNRSIILWCWHVLWHGWCKLSQESSSVSEGYDCFFIPSYKRIKSEYSTKIDRTTYKNNGWKKGYQRTTLGSGTALICCC